MGFDAAKCKEQVLAPSENDIYDFLAGQKTLPKEKKIYLRMYAWWKANDSWRRLSDPKPAFSPEQVQNLNALSAIFDESLPGHRILEAEIARKLGRFDGCLLLLSYQFDEDYGFLVGFIKKLAEEKVGGGKAI